MKENKRNIKQLKHNTFLFQFSPTPEIERSVYFFSSLLLFLS